MAPVVRALTARPDVRVSTCLTGQHRQMVEQVLRFFDLRVDHDLNIMQPNQTVTDVTVNALRGLSHVFRETRPDWVVVQGDTTTTFAAALEAFYQKILVAHVEAGLRTNSRYSPFPEEMNRVLTGRLTDAHFAPTDEARDNLLREGVDPSSVEVTGNTVADALRLAAARLADPDVDAQARKVLPQLDSSKSLVLVTGHRRESFGAPFRDFCAALHELSERESVEIVFPVHLNPNVRQPVGEILAGLPNVHLIEPVEYPTLVWLAMRSRFIITDSGGIQEEAASLGKPVLVTRETTERMESVRAGISRLVGTSREAIVSSARALLHDPGVYTMMSRQLNLYGDGNASERIAEGIVRRSGTA